MTTTNEIPAPNELHPIINKILLSRGWKRENLDEFFSWDLKSLPDLTNLLDLEKASLRIIQAIKNKEKIGIYGDYDVDGTTSCALLFHFFKYFDIEVETFQPSRFIEGYGIHPSSIEKACDKDVRVLITVDCGITNVEAAEYALFKGIDLIITDHHTDAAEVIPPAYAVINPNRRDESQTDLKYLAGVGVAFCLALKIKQLWEKENKALPSIYPLLQFVAIGTISDMALLGPMNLKFCRHGLKQMLQTEIQGLLYFVPPEERVGKMLPSEKISFLIGPLINSKGRLEHPEKALTLLTSNDPALCFECFSHLEISNRERKFIQNEVFQAAKRQVIRSIDSEDPIINVVYEPGWHEGVIGIVASKLVETFEVPAVVFTESETPGVIKASARSAGELSIFDALKSCEDLFMKFGGHKSAAGLSMDVKNLQEFKTRIKKYLKEIPHISRTKQDHFDLEIKFEDIDEKLVKALDELEPFGNGNSRPIFKMKNIKIESFQILKDQHVKWEISDHNGSNRKIKGISFFYIGKWNQLSPDEIYRRQDEGVSMQFQLGINRFNGREYIQLMVDKVTLGQLH